MVSENISDEFKGILEQILGLGANFGQDTLEIRKVQQLIETN